MLIFAQACAITAWSSKLNQKLLGRTSGDRYRLCWHPSQFIFF
ncbi:hypothetical protein [Nostoc sp. UIC 10630]|nr:hypothetical protein [Nostoc sp. UIC 10630]